MDVVDAHAVADDIIAVVAVVFAVAADVAVAVAALFARLSDVAIFAIAMDIAFAAGAAGAVDLLLTCC